MTEEIQFLRNHADDTDDELLEYLNRAKLKARKLRPLEFVGSCYIEQRFGGWKKAMTMVNREIAANRKFPEQAARGAVRGKRRLRRIGPIRVFTQAEKFSLQSYLYNLLGFLLSGVESENSIKSPVSVSAFCK